MLHCCIRGFRDVVISALAGLAYKEEKPMYYKNYKHISFIKKIIKLKYIIQKIGFARIKYIFEFNSRKIYSILFYCVIFLSFLFAQPFIMARQVVAKDYQATGVLQGQVSYQFDIPPVPNWSYPLNVTLISNGQTETYQVEADESGSFSLLNLTPGEYEAGVQSEHSLREVDNITIISGINSHNFGSLREGDVDHNNFINIIDFSILSTNFGMCEGTAGYDERADFNGDNCVILVDFSLLSSNFGEEGDQFNTTTAQKILLVGNSLTEYMADNFTLTGGGNNWAIEHDGNGNPTLTEGDFTRWTGGNHDLTVHTLTKSGADAAILFRILMENGILREILEYGVETGTPYNAVIVQGRYEPGEDIDKQFNPEADCLDLQANQRCYYFHSIAYGNDYFETEGLDDINSSLNTSTKFGFHITGTALSTDLTYNYNYRVTEQAKLNSEYLWIGNQVGATKYLATGPTLLHIESECNGTTECSDIQFDSACLYEDHCLYSDGIGHLNFKFGRYARLASLYTELKELNNLNDIPNYNLFDTDTSTFTITEEQHNAIFEWAIEARNSFSTFNDPSE
jgi:hypothetical protein